MPELPDISVYVERLDAHVRGRPLRGIRLGNPFLLRSVVPPLPEAFGREVVGVERLGKRVVLALDGALFLVIHLMIAGRLRWRPADAKLPGRVGMAAFDFPNGTVVLTEAGTKRRASLHVVAGRDGLAAFDRGGLDVFAASPAAFAERLRAERHTLKRSLTDPRILDGIGNAFSDEILHAARLSPLRMSTALTDDELSRLYQCCRDVLTQWTDTLRAEVGGGFPEEVTAFRPGMAVHGRYRQPCPVCGHPVQRIVHGEHETNYCASCQNEGRVLADRALSRLLHDDWPRTLEQMEALRPAGAPS